MMNVVRSLYFSQEIKEQSVLTSLDASRMVLVADNHAFILSFNPSITEQSNNLCIDIQNVSIPSGRSWSGDELEEESKTFSLEEKLEKVFDRGVKCVVPFYVQRVKRSILAMIVSKSCLIIYLDNFDDVDEAINFQDVLKDETRSAYQVPLQSLTSDAVRTQEFEKIFCSKLKVSCVGWSEDLTNCMEGNHSTVYLAVSHLSGFITIWSVDVFSGRFGLLRGIDVGGVVVEEMMFFQCCRSTYLCASFRDGRVCLLEFLPSESGSSWLDVTYVWDNKDHISTNGMTYVGKHQMLAIPKNQYLVLVSFDLSDDRQKVFSMQTLQLDIRFYISGVVPLEFEVIIGAFDGHLFRVPLTGEKNLKEEQVMLPWDSKEWNVFGARESRNKVYLAVVVYPSKFYCTRAIKQPSAVHYISLMPTENICTLVMNHSGPLYEIFDALCHLKHQLSRGSAWPRDIVDYMNETDAWEEYSASRLKVIRSLFSVHLLYLPEGRKDEKERAAMLLKRLETLITVQHISMVFQMVSSLDPESLLPLENLSLCVMKYFAGSASTHANFQTIHNLSTDLKEYCPICCESVIPEDHGRGSCINGHVLARCCQTLLLCSSFPHRTCIVCKSSALQKTELHPLFDNILVDTCTYCDGTLKLMEGF